MATTLGQLRSIAKSLDIPVGDIRGASSEELQALITKQLNGASTKAPATRKAPAKRTPARKTATKTVARKPARTAAKTPVKSKPAAKSTTRGKAQRSTSVTGNGGRHLLIDVDYNQTDGWNARPDTAPDLIVRALRKFNGNRGKVFTNLLPKIGTFVGKTDAQGRKRTKDSAEAMLRYRISRTAWDFAMKTGQHQKSTDRAEYGTGGTGTGAATKPQKAKATPRATRKPAGAQKAAQRPARASKTVAKKRTVAKKKTARR